MCHPHHVAYRQYLEKERERTTEDELGYFDAIEAELKSKEISCFKYNHSLEAVAQNFCTFQSKLAVSEDGETLTIYNLKPRQKIYSN